MRLFYRQVIIHRGIPFDIRIPNKETIAAFSELSNERRTLQSYHSAKEMLADVLPKSVQKEMRRIVSSSHFKRDLKRLHKKGYELALLTSIVDV